MAELIIYIGIISLVLTSMSIFVMNMIRIRGKQIAAGEVAYNAWLIEERLSEAARHSQGINTGSSTFGSDPGVLSFDMVDVADNPTIFSLSADDEDFQVSIGGASNTTITTDRVGVTNLTFTDLTSGSDLGIILVNFSVSYSNDSGTPYFNYEESFQTTLRVPLD